MLQELIQRYRKASIEKLHSSQIKKFIQNGKIPWSIGYALYKENYIQKSIHDQQLLNSFSEKKIPTEYGIQLDERVVEYPWIFSKLKNIEEVVLDAGSTFNYSYIVNHPIIAKKELSILTYYPEAQSFNEKRISYIYADLRNIPTKDNYYDVVISQSTIEHIDMDNSIYGYSDDAIKDKPAIKSYEYMTAIKELVRVVKPNGTVLITFPFGKFENHIFFQQFDSDMLQYITTFLNTAGNYQTDFIKYTKTGWRFTNETDCKEIVSYNPHTGIGKGDDNAAHCRAVCCISFIKK